MPMIHPCGAPGCTTLTMGALCLEHELKRDSAARAGDGAGDGAREHPASRLAATTADL